MVVVFAGVDAAGKSETVNLLNEWMDPRWIVTRAFGDPSDEERERPEAWRFWRELPPRGRIGLFPERLVLAARRSTASTAGARASSSSTSSNGSPSSNERWQTMAR